jgi:RNA polymerase sigma-70 factor (ECF subfamily)
VTATCSELADELARAATGDTEAFMRFYDATSGYVYGLALARARSRGLRAAAAQAFAQREVEAWYALAWTRCSEHRASGLSPLAWVLALPRARPAEGDEVACA